MVESVHDPHAHLNRCKYRKEQDSRQLNELIENDLSLIKKGVDTKLKSTIEEIEEKTKLHIDALITDSGADTEFLEKLRGMDIQVIVK